MRREGVALAGISCLTIMADRQQRLDRYGCGAALRGFKRFQYFDTYESLRLAEMPKVETVIVPTYDFWGGVGEPTICVVAPAVLNAIFAATGKPVRSLPLKNVKLV